MPHNPLDSCAFIYICILYLAPGLFHWRVRTTSVSNTINSASWGTHTKTLSQNNWNNIQCCGNAGTVNIFVVPDYSLVRPFECWDKKALNVMLGVMIRACEPSIWGRGLRSRTISICLKRKKWFKMTFKEPKGLFIWWYFVCYVVKSCLRADSSAWWHFNVLHYLWNK